jgi:uncharacterized protein YcaQ
VIGAPEHAFTLSRETHRRAVLGLQGLWPGRRFAGGAGVGAALREMHALQLDPLNVTGRSQHIALYGRVLGYEPGALHAMAYQSREAFDYGDWLNLYPIETFRFWRTPMRRARNAHLAEFRAKYPSAIRSVKRSLRANGPMANRDFAGRALGEWSYRGRKDTALALHLMWLLGDVMITERRGFDRVYDLTERVLPPAHAGRASEREAEAFFAEHVVALHGVLRERSWRSLTGFAQRVGREAAAQRGARVLEEALERGTLERVQVEGSGESWLALAQTLPLLGELEAGHVPDAWKPLGPSTEEEVTLLAPLEIAIARGRAQPLFGFDYVWEVYKPAHKRRWGYYTLPVLWGDRLVARLDPRFDRTSGSLELLGFWLEEGVHATPALADALARGLARFARMLGAERVDASRVRPARLAAYLKRELAAHFG